MAGFAISIILALAVTEALGDGTYFVAIPDTIKAGFPYVISVHILNGSNVEVSAAITQSKYNRTEGKTYVIEHDNVTGVFSQGVGGLLEIPIKDTFNLASCDVRIKGRGSQVFERTSRRVAVNAWDVNVLTQTDKAIYKPGQIVRYRAFGVDPNKKIIKGDFRIEFRDPNNNKIAIQEKSATESGVVEGFLKLSDQPPFGDWSIHAFPHNSSAKFSEKYFTVEQYELPRFEVTVDLPSYGLLSERALSGKIKARYTYGKPVKGMVELNVGPDQNPDRCGVMPKSVNIAFEIDGEGRFTIPKSSIQRVMILYQGTKVRVTAFVKESATGVKLNGSNVIQYHSNEYSVSFMSNTPNVFKPGLPYTAYVQVKSPDELPPPEDMNNEIVIYSYATYQVTVVNQTNYGINKFTGDYPLPTINNLIPADGIVPIYFHIPKNATKISFKAYFGDISVSKTVEKSYSPSNNYAQLNMDGSNIEKGDIVDFELKATEALHTVNYEVMTRGVIVETGTFEANGQHTFSFNLEISTKMAPSAKLLMYYVREDGEVVADSIAFSVDGFFENEVTVDFATEKAQPGTNVQLKVSADPKSQVYLLAVDQSVLLLKSGNDITTNEVEKIVSDETPLDSELAISNNAKNIDNLFKQMGLRVLTDSSKLSPPTVISKYGGSRYGSRAGYSSFGPQGNAFMVPAPSRSSSGLQGSLSSPERGVAAVKPLKKVRNFFPEAWLWTDVSTQADGTASINTTVPDTITTWIASAFATNENSGLGVAPVKANLTVFRSFFVSLTYPSLMKRKEQAVIQATVFNYLSSDLRVFVTLTNSTGYQYFKMNDNGVGVVIEEMQPQGIMVRANSHGVVYFPIMAKEIGTFDIEVKAQSNLAADGVRRQITIEAEGAPTSYNIPIFIEQYQTTKSYRKRHSLTFPRSRVPGSERISVGVSGDLIGPSLPSLDNSHKLLSIPMGCGEQSMATIAPNLYIGQYLESTGQLTSFMRDNIVKKLALGYQRQLTYQRYDGSFSAFGNSDESGSTWLTAYVSRVLSEAREFIYVDPKIIERSVAWLVERQRDDGAFVELGNVIDPNTQGNTGPGLSAFVLLTLLQNQDFYPKKCNGDCFNKEKWENATTKVINYLEDKLDSIEDPFPLSVVTYALSEARSRRSQAAYQKLKSKSVRQRGLVYWNGVAKSKSTPAPRYAIWRPPHVQSRPINILITSYALLSYVARDQVKRALPIVKWITSQRNSLGGFSSTQDTVLALQALSAFAKRSVHPNTQLNVNFRGDDQQTLTFTINKDNLLNYQIDEFKNVKPKRRFNVDVSARGIGLALAEIKYDFNIYSAEPSEAFDVSTVLLDDDLDSFNLMICTKFLKDGKSGMVVQEIGIPSGFELDFTTIGNVVGMKRYERRGNVAAIYFDEIVKTSTCYDMLMTRKAKVANSGKSFVRTFSYYLPEDTSTVFYHPKKPGNSNICDVCDKCCSYS